MPCAHPETCGPQQPICLPCIAGRDLFLKDYPYMKWENLDERQRESWRQEAADSAAETPTLEAKLAKLGVQLVSIPPSTGEEKLRLEGWREGIERQGQALWMIYHWIVKAQDGKTHGIYRLRDWLEEFNVPDNTDRSGDYPVWRDI